MKKQLTMAILLFLFISTSCSKSQNKFGEIIHYQKLMIESMEKVTVLLKKNIDAPKEIAANLFEFVAEIKPVIDKGEEIKKKYPKYTSDMPVEIKNLIEVYQTKRAEFDIIIKMIKFKYEKNELVQEALLKLNEYYFFF